MIGTNQTDLSNFFITGINYKKTDADLRGQYAVNNDQYIALLHLAASYNIKELFVLSTCNRTEIYGFAENAADLAALLCTQTKGTAAIFKTIAYTKKGQPALEHLFQVAAGLDSQILGDYEIVGQIKLAVKIARQHDKVGVYLDRIINNVLQSSRNIRTNTALSGGTVSVSFAAMQYIKEKYSAAAAGKKILLVGTGKIGRNTCKNLLDNLGTKNITLINRTDEKASQLAKELGLSSAPYSHLAEEVAAADVIMVATNSAQPVILASQLAGHGEKLVIDLSIPYNVETTAKDLTNVTLVNIDELSKIKDNTLQQRKLEVPKALSIIAEQINDFIDWHKMRQHVPVLKAVKQKLETLETCNLYNSYSATLTPAEVTCLKPEEKIQKVINGMAVKMRQQNQKGCSYIEAINEYMVPATN